MFGIGPQELIIIGLLFLVIFGPKKLPGMAKDIGRFVNEARNHIDEFKSELTTSAESKNPRRSVEKSKSDHPPEEDREDDLHRKPSPT
jgi:sec-independent protein translocase protein TatB